MGTMQLKRNRKICVARGSDWQWHAYQLWYGWLLWTLKSVCNGMGCGGTDSHIWFEVNWIAFESSKIERGKREAKSAYYRRTKRRWRTQTQNLSKLIEINFWICIFFHLILRESNCSPSIIFIARQLVGAKNAIQTAHNGINGRFKRPPYAEK